jgi:serine/threonine protein phosphatase PrpC
MKVLTASSNRLGNRSSNQDRCLVLEKPDRVLLAVADGMGGHARGDLAAQTAVNSFSDSFLSQCEAIAEPEQFLKAALEIAHLETVEAGRTSTPPIEPRTTCVVCLIQGNQAWWAHVGDSRLYLLRAGSLLTRTRDHTPVEELLKSGVIHEDELSTHPLRNSVSRCLGGALRLPKISFDHAELQPGDTLLLCSDGLWSALPEQTLLDVPASGDLEFAVNELTDKAEKTSYPHSDNISLVGLRWLSAGESKTFDTDSSAEQHSEAAPVEEKDPLQQAIDDIHRAILDYAPEMKK